MANLGPEAPNFKKYENACDSLGLIESNVAEIEASTGPSACPFQSHSRTPPPRLRNEARPSSRGSDFNSAKTSRKFDLPEPFGPMSTFRGPRDISSVSGPKDRMFLG